MRLTYYESLKSNKSYHDKSTYTVRSCLREFYWIYRCKRIANADTQNIRIANADGRGGRGFCIKFEFCLLVIAPDFARSNNCIYEYHLIK